MKIAPYLGLAVLAPLLLALIKQSIRDKVAGWFASTPFGAWLLMGILFGFNALICWLGNSWDGEKLGKFLFYLLEPALICSVAYSNRDLWENTKWLKLVTVLSVVFWIWLLVEFNVAPMSWKVAGAEYPFGGISALIFCLIAFPAFLKADLKLDWKFSWQDLKWILGVFAVLFILIVPLVLAIGFIHFGLNSKIENWFLMFPMIWLGVALVEELIFRAMIQRLLMETLGPLPGLVAGALVFGLAHVNNVAGIYGVPNWPYVGFATIAGLGYGWVYYRRNLQSATTLHCLVDFTWWLIFKAGK